MARWESPIRVLWKWLVPMTGPLLIKKLQRTHAVEDFTCGQRELDRLLARHALQAQQAHSSQTYVGVSGTKIVGFYTIVVG
jgi:hypothetical protein